MTFLLSASGMSLSNESSSLLLKVSHLVARLYRTLYLNVLLIGCIWNAGRGLTLFRSHLSKILSAVGRIFQIFCPLEVQFFKFMSVLSQISFISLL